MSPSILCLTHRKGFPPGLPKFGTVSQSVNSHLLRVTSMSPSILCLIHREAFDPG